MTSIKTLQNKLLQLKGLPCWYVSSGGNLGSTFKLFLGKKIPRQTPFPPRKVGERSVLADFTAEQRLLVWCSWRLDGSGQKPLSSSTEASEQIITGLNAIVGQKIRDCSVSLPSLDLDLSISGGLSLKIFCDQTAHSEGVPQNWELFSEEERVSAGPGYEWVIEKRTIQD